MNSAIIIAAIAFLATLAQAERGERDPDQMAAIAATILIFDRDCEQVSPKLEEAAGIAVQFCRRAESGGGSDEYRGPHQKRWEGGVVRAGAERFPALD